MKDINKRNIKSLMLILSTIMATVLVTYSWFIERTAVKSGTVNFRMEVDKSILISTSKDRDWRYEYVIDSDKFKFSPITSDGFDFYIPEFSEEVIDAQTNYSVLGRQVTDYVKIDNPTDPSYIETFFYQELYFKCYNPLNVYIDIATAINPVDKTKTNYYGFSNDMMAGAARIVMMLTDEYDIPYKTIIWIPNTTYELIYSDGVYSFDENGTVEDNYKFIDCDASEITDYIEVETSGNASGQYTYTDLSGREYQIIYGPITEAIPIGKIRTGVNKFNLAFYIDGNDRECEYVTSGGKIEITIEIKSGYTDE